MQPHAKQLGEVLEDALLERGFEMETFDGSGGDYYVSVFDRGSKYGLKDMGQYRLTPEGEILSIGKPSAEVEDAIRDRGFGPRLGRDRKREIFVAFEIVTPESAEAGDFEETGEERTDEVEPDYDETFADAAVKYLRHEGAGESGGDWFESEGGTDYRTGAETTYTYHLKGFTEAEEDEIWREMGAKRRR